MPFAESGTLMERPELMTTIARCGASSKLISAMVSHVEPTNRAPADDA
ncbi:hypothetical protein [Streptomyces sp. YGL11-2]